MKLFSTLGLLAVTASPAFANGDEPYFSMNNTHWVVMIAFLAFIAVLLKLKVPGKVTALLDERAVGIQSDLDEARKLREEAQGILAEYERKQKEVAEQAKHIVATAKAEAELAAKQAQEDLKTSIARRLAAAEDQIASAQAAAVKEVRDTAATIAVGVAGDVIAKKMTAKDAGSLIDAAIKEVGDKLH